MNPLSPPREGAAGQAAALVLSLVLLISAAGGLASARGEEGSASAREPASGHPAPEALDPSCGTVPGGSSQVVCDPVDSGPEPYVPGAPARSMVVTGGFDMAAGPGTARYVEDVYLDILVDGEPLVLGSPGPVSDGGAVTQRADAAGLAVANGFTAVEKADPGGGLGGPTVKQAAVLTSGGGAPLHVTFAFSFTTSEREYQLDGGARSFTSEPVVVDGVEARSLYLGGPYGGRLLYGWQDLIDGGYEPQLVLRDLEGGDGGAVNEVSLVMDLELGPGETLVLDPTFDLTTDKDLVVYGAGSNDELGVSMVSGDLDGDGEDDIIMGAPSGDGPGDARSNCGEVHVIFGNTTANLGSSKDLASQSEAMFYGPTAGDHAGFSLEAVDLNLDGRDDLIIGAPDADGPGGARPGCGEVYVVYGDIWANLSGNHDLATRANVTVMGPAGNANLGWDVAGGDVLGNPKLELVMGAPNDNSGTGAVHALDGASLADRDLGVLAADAVILGESSGDDFGTSVACGEMSDDPDDDILAGAPGRFVGGSGVGAAYGIWGGSLPATTDLSVTGPDVYLPGTSSQGYAGIHVCSGDMDGDGIDDLVVSAPDAMGGGTRSGSGEVYVNYGSGTLSGTVTLQTSSDFVVIGAGANDGLGSGIGLGDVDGDGMADLVMGANNADGPSNARNSAGEGYLLFGEKKQNMSSVYDIAAGAVQHVFYGIDSPDETGNSVALGDIDGDGLDDVLMGANYADGPGNGRADSGEVYAVYGDALTIYNDFCVLVDGYHGGKTVFAGYRAYTIQVNLTERLGPLWVDTVTLILGFGSLDLEYRFSTSAGSFVEVSDPNKYARLNGTSYFTHDSVKQLGLRFQLVFNWNYPNENLMDVRVISTNSLSGSATSDHYQLYKVENDLDLEGELTAAAEWQGPLSDGDWVRGAENMTFGNVSAVYQGTTDVFPQGDAFNITVTNDDGEKFLNTTDDPGPFTIDVPANADTDPEDIHTVDITEIPAGATDVSDVDFTVRVDADGPEAPAAVALHADLPSDMETEFDDDTEVYATWTAASDGAGCGVSAHYMEYTDDTPDEEGVSGDSVTVEAGEAVVWVRARDSVGNWGESANATMIIDLEGVMYTGPGPGENEWVKNQTSTINVTITDIGGSGIDEASVYFAKSVDGPEGFTGWTQVNVAGSMSTDGSTAVPSAVTAFEEGTDNYIKWKAADRAGDDVTESDLYNVMVDWTPVSFADLPDETVWYRDGSMDCSITVKDTVSGVRADSVRYSYSTEGTDEASFSDWSAEGVELTAVENGYTAAVNLEFPDGDDNYVRWIAKDIAGNAVQFSGEMNYLVDTAGVEFGALRPGGEPWTSSAEYTVRAAISDAASGVDPASISCAVGPRLSSMGSWESAGMEDGGTSLVAEVVVDLEEGDNYVVWRAADEAGNDPVTSEAVLIRRDVTPPVFSKPFPGPGDVSEQLEVTCTVEAADTGGSGVNGSTAQYSFSTTGPEGFGGWIDAKTAPGTGGAGTVVFQAELEFVEDGQNLIRWRAADMVGNGPSVSADFSVVVNIPRDNMPPTAVIDSPPTGGAVPVYKSGTHVHLDASNSTDPDDDGLAYMWRSDIQGDLGYNPNIYVELEPGTHNITLFVEDGVNGEVNTTFQVRILPPDAPQDGEDGENGEDGEDGTGPADGGGGGGGEDDKGMLGMGSIGGFPVFILLLIVIIAAVAGAAGAGVAVNARKKREREERKKKEEEDRKRRMEEAEAKAWAAMATPVSWGQKAHAGGSYVGMAGPQTPPPGYRKASVEAAAQPLSLQRGYDSRVGAVEGPYSAPEEVPVQVGVGSPSTSPRQAGGNMAGWGAGQDGVQQGLEGQQSGSQPPAPGGAPGGQTPGDLRAGGQTPGDLRAGGQTPGDLRADGQTPGDLRAGGQTPGDLQAGDGGAVPPTVPMAQAVPQGEAPPGDAHQAGAGPQTKGKGDSRGGEGDATSDFFNI